MKLNSKDLLKDLKTKTEQYISIIREFQKLSDEQLNFRKSENSWTILECIQHLINYAQYYYPKTNDLVEKSNSKPKETFSPGILGNYFANTMLPGNSMKKMKSPQDKNPSGEQLFRENISYFLQQQDFLLDILEKAENVNLEKVKIPISIAKFLKLKLGDTLRFIVYHNERHIRQAQNTLK